MTELTERLKRYYSLTERALKKVKIKSNLAKKEKTFAEDFLDMAQRYFSDAKYFEKQNDLPTALAAVTYAHAWLDAGARIGLFETGGDTELFAAE
jgi:uncharacterized protein